MRQLHKEVKCHSLPVGHKISGTNLSENHYYHSLSIHHLSRHDQVASQKNVKWHPLAVGYRRGDASQQFSGRYLMTLTACWSSMKQPFRQMRNASHKLFIIRETVMWLLCRITHFLLIENAVAYIGFQCNISLTIYLWQSLVYNSKRFCNITHILLTTRKG